jgi:hypothetical protein
MYRYRRRSKLQRRRRAAVVAVFSAALALVVGVPTLAAADPVNDALNGLGVGSGSGGASGGGTASPQQLEPPPAPPYTPPLHGTNPHGQGTNAVVDIAPSADLPYSSDPNLNGEEVVVGQTRGEQNTTTGQYHGSATVLFLFGNPLTPLQVETDPGETKSGPFEGLNQALNQICTQSSGQLCLTVLDLQSSTTNSGSTNSFTGASVGLGGEEGLGVSALQSNGNISSDGTCQTSSGSSSVAGVSAGGSEVAGLFDSSSSSTACNNGQQSTTNSSRAIALGGQEVLPPGCENGTENALNLFLIVLYCNQDDTNGSDGVLQTFVPYGVREAFTTTVLPIVLLEGGLEAQQVDGLPISLIKATTSAAESHAVAPPAQVTPTTPPGAPPAALPGGGTKGAGGQGGADAGGPGAGAGGPGAGAGGAGAAAAEAGAGAGELAFTGADLLALGLLGGALILGGLALSGAARHRHRQTV